jgi:hypothetical protein
MSVKKRRFIIILSFLFILALLVSCAADPSRLRVQDSLPQDELAYYCDNFDKLREDLWDRAGYLYREEQLKNFVQADMHFKNGKLIVRTKTGKFSKGGLSSKYWLKGDFDIQLDCRMEFVKGASSMDQMFIFGVFDTSTKIEDNNRVVVGLSKKESAADIYLSSSYFIGGRKVGGNSKPIDNFSGALRILRNGKHISALYKSRKTAEWSLMGTFHVTDNDLLVGFGLSNFFPERTAIRAEHPLSVEIDSFNINAAQEIVEEEI